jgi:hypothetical protein
VAIGLVLAAAAWRLPYIQGLEAPAEADPDEPAHGDGSTPPVPRAPTQAPAPDPRPGA